MTGAVRTGQSFASLGRSASTDETADAAAFQAIKELRCIGEVMEFLSVHTPEPDGMVSGAWVEWLGDRIGCAAGDLSDWASYQHKLNW